MYALLLTNTDDRMLVVIDVALTLLLYWKQLLMSTVTIFKKNGSRDYENIKASGAVHCFIYILIKQFRNFQREIWSKIRFLWILVIQMSVYPI